MTSIRFSCRISTTDPTTPLGVEAWIDDHKFFDSEHVEQTQDISTDIDDDEAEHVLRLILKNKLPSHTKIDQDGNIVQDARIVIEDVSFDEIKLGYTMTKLAKYTHDFNGTGAETVQVFHGEMGCNGVVRLEFTTPVYLWLLEHM